MNQQQTFADIEYSHRRRITRREEFLNTMDAIVPWAQWAEIIQPYYYNNTHGRKPKDIEVMLRMYLMQNWFHLSEEGIEDAMHDSYAMRRFLGIHFTDEQVPDSTTLHHFRSLLEEHKLGKRIFEDVTNRLNKLASSCTAAQSLTRPSSKRQVLYDGINCDKQVESQKSSVRSKVEHIFLIVKQFGYAKVAYRGIEKNLNRCYVLFARANLLLCARAGRTEDFCRG